MKIKHLLSAAFAAVVLASYSNKASAIPFDFRSYSSNFASDMTFTNGDLSVNVTASSNNGTPLTVYQGPLGLGVKSGSGDNLELDGDSPKEELTLAFNKQVTFNDIWFGLVDLDDCFKLWIDGKLVYNADIPGFGIIEHVDAVADLGLTTEDLTGTTFLFTVKNKFDDYKLIGLDISKATIFEPVDEIDQNVELPNSSATPEPVTATLGLLSLGGLVVATRRRRTR